MKKFYLIVMLVLWGVASSSLETKNLPKLFPTPTPTFISNRTLPSLLPHLQCPSIEPPYLGSTWETITIGESTIEDLNNHIHTLHPEYQSNISFGDEISYHLTPSIASNENLPVLIYACFIPSTHIITGLYLPQSGRYRRTLQDMIRQYGLPDTMVWSGYDDRMALWLEQGIGASIDITPTSSEKLTNGDVGVIIYFPHQSLVEY